MVVTRGWELWEWDWGDIHFLFLKKKVPLAPFSHILGFVVVLILLPLPSKCWNYRHVSPHPEQY
jgi:hypothetical protein